MNQPVRLLQLVLVFLFLSSSYQKAIAQDPPKTLPSFLFYTTKEIPFTKMQVSSSKPLVVMFFDPGCDHCQKQAEWIRAAEAKFAPGTQFLFVSIAQPAEIDAFEKKYFAGTKLDVKFVYDKKFAFDGYFGYSVAPTILIFDSKGNMVKRYTEEASADEIAQYAK